MANRFFEGTAHVALYAKYRPSVPFSVIDRIVSYLHIKLPGARALMVDVGCGSGQNTEIIAKKFDKILATDVSPAQIAEAKKISLSSNVIYQVSPAEKTLCSDNSVQLITACQACHWFDMEAFYQEVERVLVPGGVVALIGYQLPVPVLPGMTDQLNEVVQHTYNKDLNGFVLENSREVYIENYRNSKYNLPYNDRIDLREHEMYCDIPTSLDGVLGYISTWSGYQNLREKHGDEAATGVLEAAANKFRTITNEEDLGKVKVILRFEYFVLMGRKPLA